MHAVVERPDAILKDPMGASSAAIRAFEKIAGRWNLSPAQRQTILGLPRSTYFKVRGGKNARLSRDTLERVSYVLGIYGALQVLLPRKEAADQWVRTGNDNALFKGHAPLETMLRGKVSDLYVVRHYLDAQRGW
jgi:uncharacterized protein (DUF2384 family)